MWLGDLRGVEPGVTACGYDLPEMLGVQIDDDGRKQVETGHSVMLALVRPVPDFALPPDAKGTFQRVVYLAFIQAHLGVALHVGIRKPFDDEIADGSRWGGMPEKMSGDRYRSSPCRTSSRSRGQTT